MTKVAITANPILRQLRSLAAGALGPPSGAGGSGSWTSSPRSTWAIRDSPLTASPRGASHQPAGGERAPDVLLAPDGPFKRLHAALATGRFAVLTVGGAAIDLPASLAGLACAVRVDSALAAAVAAAGIGALVGIGFKVAAVPVHSWCPDVFEGAPLEVTAFLSVASKGAGIVLLLRLMAITSGVPGLGAAAVTVGVVGAVTATVGNTAAIKQTGMKRLLAYSSIAQAGYLLCLLTPATNPADSSVVARAVLLYLAVYALMNLGAFAVTAVVERQTGGDKIADFAGLGRSSPAAAVSMVLCLLSLIGLPPVSGLAAKVNLLWIVGRTGPFGRGLALIILINTVISAFYYFRIIRAMYFEPAGSQRNKTGLWSGAWVGIGCAAALVITFVAFGPLYAAVSHVGLSATPTVAAPLP